MVSLSYSSAILVPSSLFSLKKEGNPAIYRFMDETEGHYAKWNKPDGDRQVLYDITYTLKKKKKSDSE